MRLFFYHCIIFFYIDNLNRYEEQQRITATKVEIKRLIELLEHYKSKFGFYPNTEKGLHELVDTSFLKPQMKGGFLVNQPIPRDGWGNNFAYIYHGKSNAYELISFGADGLPGGKGIINQDITNLNIK